MGGKTCLVTGATSGIGYETALGLARAGARVGIVGRDAGKVRACADAIRAAAPGVTIDGFVADLAAQAEIRRLADEIRALYPRLDVLVNNAGAIFDRRETTIDGFERTWALDHLGYVLLTLELLDLLKASGRPGAGARIVNVASAAHTRGRIAFDDLQGEHSYGALRAYSQAKLGNVLFTYALARRLAGSTVTVNALHPGVIDTGFAKNTGGLFGTAWGLIRPFLTKPADGAATSLHLATAPSVEGVSGRYFARSRETSSSAYSRDEAVQERTFALSLAQVGHAA
ncbi:SDR family NAD(P)-dependent oxidoreductase [uncultured Methylobacterium sp.]|uniref:SDR family NAD(P)-dependent oxidoreductase n=1 Tax=uncultured Methylobacterium sp. TaxID=157278 RepID=UPI0035CC63B9